MLLPGDIYRDDTQQGPCHGASGSSCDHHSSAIDSPERSRSASIQRQHQPKQARPHDRQPSAHLADFGCLELCILENKYDSLRRGRYCFLLRFYRRCAKTTNHFNYANICRNALKVACAVQILALSDRFLCSLSEIYCPSAEHQGHVAIRSNYGALKTQL